MSENVSDGWACNCPPGSDPEACFCMYANGTLMAEVTQADYDALLAERDALREAGEALANALAPTRSAVRCGEGMSPALDRVGLEAFTAWRAATGKDA